jgi:porin
MLKSVALSICAASLLGGRCHAADSSLTASPSATTPPPNFESLRIKGLNITLPGPQDTIDPDFAGIRSSLAALGIGYIGYSTNNYFDNVLPAESSTFGRQTYNGQKPTFLTNNVMQLTYDLSRYGKPRRQRESLPPKRK